MISKEQIKKEAELRFPMPDKKDFMVNRGDIIAARRYFEQGAEYAQQESRSLSIGFAEWILAHAKTVSTPVKPSLSTHDYWLFEEEVNYSQKTSQELYSKYLVYVPVK